MAYTDDWESLMNGVFGPGGKLKFSQSTPQAAQPKPEKPEKTEDSPLPDWNAALLARQKKLDEASKILKLLHLLPLLKESGVLQNIL